MPTYGYECTACEDQFEIFQGIKDDALTTCEKCGGGLRKRIYPVGIAFKGSGFYVNDYAKPSGGSGAKSAEKPASETPAATESVAAPAKTETAAPKPTTPATA